MLAPTTQSSVVGIEWSGAASLASHPDGRGAGWPGRRRRSSTSAIRTRHPPRQQGGSPLGTCADDLADEAPDYPRDDPPHHFRRRRCRIYERLKCMLIVHTGMAKTPTVERETATFRLPATLLERARKEGAARGLAYVRSVEEALEVYFFSRLPPPMAEALEQDLKDLKVSRENYFYSLLDARYRQILSKPAQSKKK